MTYQDQIKEIKKLLERAAKLLAGRSAEGAPAVDRVLLRYETSIVETVYIEIVNDEVIVHDRGETFLYIDSRADEAYRDWSAKDAEVECAAHGALLIDLSDDDTMGFRIQRQADQPISDVIESVSSAIEAVFRCHMRPFEK